jgi:hypothetical protein
MAKSWNSNKLLDREIHTSQILIRSIVLYCEYLFEKPEGLEVDSLCLKLTFMKLELNL